MLVRVRPHAWEVHRIFAHQRVELTGGPDASADLNVAGSAHHGVKQHATATEHAGAGLATRTSLTNLACRLQEPCGRDPTSCANCRSTSSRCTVIWPTTTASSRRRREAITQQQRAAHVPPTSRVWRKGVSPVHPTHSAPTQRRCWDANTGGDAPQRTGGHHPQPSAQQRTGHGRAGLHVKSPSTTRAAVAGALAQVEAGGNAQRVRPSIEARLQQQWTRSPVA